MNNKEYRRLGSKIKKKLESLGVSDKISMIPLKKTRRVLVMGEKGLESHTVPILQASNLNRRITKQVLSMGKETALKFLSTENSELQKAVGKPEEKSTEIETPSL